jgi:hypothetical protein
MNEHQYCEDHEVKPGERLRRLLVVACESAKPVQPAEAAHQPAAWQKHEALFGLRQLDYLKLNAFRERFLRGLFASRAPDDRTQVLRISPQRLRGLPSAVSAASLIALTVYNAVVQRRFSNRLFIDLGDISFPLSRPLPHYILRLWIVGRFGRADFNYNSDCSQYVFPSITLFAN